MHTGDEESNVTGADSPPSTRPTGDHLRSENFDELVKNAQQEEKEIKEHRKCHKWMKDAVYSDETISHLMYSLETRGCWAFPGKFFHCKPCENPAEGYWDQEEGVVICQNHLSSKRRVAETVAHELIHAFDECRGEVDWSDCEHQACTEVRAANLSGDCGFANELLRGNMWDIGGRQKSCVRRRAELSLRSQPHCRENAMRTVDRVVDRCFYDYEPFDHAP